MGKNKDHIFLVFMLMHLFLPGLHAQTNHLEQKISIDLDRVKLKNALPKIGEAAGFQFSYNSGIIPGDSIVSLHAKDQQVKRILKDLTGPKIRYKVLGNHVILMGDEPAKSVPEWNLKKEYTINGYIYEIGRAHV